MSASDWAKTPATALEHIADADVMRALKSAEKSVARASAAAFAAAPTNATARRRAWLRMRLDTACEARDTWLRIAAGRGLLAALQVAS